MWLTGLNYNTYSCNTELFPSYRHPCRRVLKATLLSTVASFSHPLWSPTLLTCAKWGQSTVLLNTQLTISELFKVKNWQVASWEILSACTAPWSLQINVSKNWSLHFWSEKSSRKRKAQECCSRQSGKFLAFCALCSQNSHVASAELIVLIIFGCFGELVRNTILGSCLESHPETDLSGHSQQGRNEVWFESLLLGKLCLLILLFKYRLLLGKLWLLILLFKYQTDYKTICIGVVYSTRPSKSW